MGWFKRGNDREPNVREIVITTLYVRANRLSFLHPLMNNRREDIADRVAAVTPMELLAQGKDALIDFLTAELEREEFSLCEDVIDGSA